jgi:hypothetical protein
VLRPLDNLVADERPDPAVPGKEMVETASRADVVVLEVQQGDTGILERAGMLRHVALDQGALVHSVSQ